MLRTLVLLSAAATTSFAAEAIAISDLKRATPVNFAAEIIPLFQKSCLACHNAGDAKGDLVLETPATIIKGGETGPAVIPGKSAESILLKSASHQSKPVMPPRNNKADAKPLTPDELGLIKLWIDQGATGTVAVLPPLRWQNLAESFNPILASAISPDGQFAACSRANQIDLYEVPTLQFAASLTDPTLGAADRDAIESLAFSPDGQLLAAGGYRSVKIWRRHDPVFRPLQTNAEPRLEATSAGHKRRATAEGPLVRLVNSGDGKVIAELKGDPREQETAARAQRFLNFAKSETSFRKSNVEAAEKNQKTEAEALRKIAETKTAAEKTLTEKNETAKKAGETKAAARKTLNDTIAVIAQANENKNLSHKLAETADAQSKSAAASAADAAQILDRAKTNRDAAYAEIIALAKADKSAEAHAAIDRALLIKLSLEHAERAKATADRAAADAAANAKLALENKTKAEKTLPDLANQQKGAEEKFKTAEKQFADADSAVKAAESLLKNVTTNFEGASAVSKKSDEAVLESRNLLAAAEASERNAAEQLDAANKRVAESEKHIRSVGFAGPWLLVATEDSTLRAYAAETGRPGPVLKLNFPPEQLDFTTANPASTWKFERQIGDGSDTSPLADRVLALDFSPDGKLLATGGGIPTRSGELKIWNVADGALVREIKDAHSDTVFSVRFSPGQMHLASGAADKLMKVFEVSTGKFVRSFEGHTHHVLNVSWLRHGRTLASGSADSTIKIWDFASGEQKKTITGASREITALQFLDSRAEALTASGDNQLRLLREDGSSVRAFSGASDYTQTAAITPDGKWLIAGGHDSQFRIWNAEKGGLLKTFPPPPRSNRAVASQ